MSYKIYSNPRRPPSELPAEPLSRPVEQKSRGGIIAIIVIIVVLLLIGGVILAVILIRRRNNANNGNGNGGGGTGNGGSGNGNNNGGGGNESPPVTPPVDNECDSSADCTGSATCDDNMCCTNAAPVIVSATGTMANVSSVNIVYTFAQRAPVAPNTSNARLRMTVQTPNGDNLTTVETANANGIANFTETQLALPNARLYPGVSYQVVLRIIYDCGGQTDLVSGASSAFGFTMPSCSDTALVASTGLFNTAGVTASYGSPARLAIQFFANPNQDFTIGVLASPTSGIHPNLVQVYYPSIATLRLAPPNDSLPFAPVPYPGGIGTTYYIRYYIIGAGCDSVLSNQQAFTRTQ